MYFVVCGNQVFADTAALGRKPAIKRILSVIHKSIGQKKTWKELEKEGFSVQNLKLDKGSKIGVLNI